MEAEELLHDFIPARGSPPPLVFCLPSTSVGTTSFLLIFLLSGANRILKMSGGLQKDPWTSVIKRRSMSCFVLYKKKGEKIIGGRVTVMHLTKGFVDSRRQSPYVSNTGKADYSHLFFPYSSLPD